jgi:hypothetical protein
VSPALKALDGMLTPATSTDDRNWVRTRAWVPSILSGVALAAGFTFIAIGSSQSRTLDDTGASLDPDTLATRRTLATSNVVGGVGLVCMGGLIGVVATVMWLWTPRSPVRAIAFAPAAGGGVFTLGGTFP